MVGVERCACPILYKRREGNEGLRGGGGGGGGKHLLKVQEGPAVPVAHASLSDPGERRRRSGCYFWVRHHSAFNLWDQEHSRGFPNCQLYFDAELVQNEKEV